VRLPQGFGFNSGCANGSLGRAGGDRGFRALSMRLRQFVMSVVGHANDKDRA